MSLSKEDLLAISQLMDEKIAPINQRLDKVDARLDKVESRLNNLEEQVTAIKEDTQITRVAVNSLVEWVDTAAPVVEIRYPVVKRKAE